MDDENPAVIEPPSVRQALTGINAKRAHDQSITQYRNKEDRKNKERCARMIKKTTIHRHIIDAKASATNN